MDTEVVKCPRSKEMDAELVKETGPELFKSPGSQPGQYFFPLKSIIDVF